MAWIQVALTLVLALAVLWLVEAMGQPKRKGKVQAQTSPDSVLMSSPQAATLEVALKRPPVVSTNVALRDKDGTILIPKGGLMVQLAGSNHYIGKPEFCSCKGDNICAHAGTNGNDLPIGEPFYPAADCPKFTKGQFSSATLTSPTWIGDKDIDVVDETTGIRAKVDSKAAILTFGIPQSLIYLCNDPFTSCETELVEFSTSIPHGRGIFPSSQATFRLQSNVYTPAEEPIFVFSHIGVDGSIPYISTARYDGVAPYFDMVLDAKTGYWTQANTSTALPQDGSLRLDTTQCGGDEMLKIQWTAAGASTPRVRYMELEQGWNSVRYWPKPPARPLNLQGWTVDYGAEDWIQLWDDSWKQYPWKQNPSPWTTLPSCHKRDT